MATKKTAPKRGPGRPPTSSPKDRLVGVRLDSELSAIVDEYMKRNGLDDAPSAIRHMIRQMREQELGR